MIPFLLYLLIGVNLCVVSKPDTDAEMLWTLFLWPVRVLATLADVIWTALSS